MTANIDWKSAALLLVDPQRDLLTPESVVWDLIGEQVTQIGLVDKLVALRDQAEQAGAPVFYSWLSVTDDDYKTWNLRNVLQKSMAQRKVVQPGRGGRFHPRLEPTASNIVLSPRKGPSAVHSDMSVQLRQRGIETIVIAGMIANLCVESHVRDAVEAGFNAVVVGDAIATTDDATLAATMNNFSLLASGVVDTKEVLASLRSSV